MPGSKQQPVFWLASQNAGYGEHGWQLAHWWNWPAEQERRQRYHGRWQGSSEKHRCQASTVLPFWVVSLFGLVGRCKENWRKLLPLAIPTSVPTCATCKQPSILRCSFRGPLRESQAFLFPMSLFCSKLIYCPSLRLILLLFHFSAPFHKKLERIDVRVWNCQLPTAIYLLHV